MTLRFGADRLAGTRALARGVARVALATNDAARSAVSAQRRTREMLLAAGLPIVRLFTPEHGLSAGAADGAPVPDGVDRLTGLPVSSLYGERLAPAPAQLRDLDAVLFDMPDVGARCYTYGWTLTHLMDACAAAGVRLYVLDRPNPLSGSLERVEGPLLEPAHQSFLGRHSIPLRHSLTLGELARLWQRERCPGADVRIVECEGWRRAQLWPETGLPFVPPSPAIGCFDAALLYPGLVLFEATNLSVARGTPHAFRALGAPWLEPAVVLDRLHACQLPGLAFAATEFTPATGPHAGAHCRGVRVRVNAAGAVRPVAAGLVLLAAVAGTHAREFRWSTYPTAANPTGAGHLERLAGTPAVRSMVEQGDPTAAELARLTAVPGWAERWTTARLYP